MKVGFLVPALSDRAGGLGDSARRLTRALSATPDLTLQVLAPSREAVPSPHAFAPPASLHPFAAVGPAPFDFAPGLGKCLQTLGLDLVHTHGLWTYLSVAAHGWHRRTRRPYVVTPHGMLDPWARRRSRWKKRLAGVFYEGRHLRDAACLHAVSAAERDAFRQLGLRNPVCVIHNGVDLPPPPNDVSPPAPWAGQVAAGRKVLLSLGRLHPKKGLLNVLRAWGAVRQSSRTLTDPWCLVIVGWDQAGHAAELRTVALDLGISGDVVFMGPLFGEAKAAAYRHADALILASFSEGMPLVVLEAWSHALPVLMTPQCNLPEGFAAGAALQAEPEPRSLSLAMADLFRGTDAERREIGCSGRALVQRSFQWSQAAASMQGIYNWLVNGQPPPAYVER